MGIVSKFFKTKNKSPKDSKLSVLIEGIVDYAEENNMEVVDLSLKVNELKDILEALSART